MSDLAAAQRTKIFLVEDHVVWRNGVRSLIEREPQYEICGEAATAAETLLAAGSLQPDIAIVDLSLGAGNGLDLIANLKRQVPGIRVLVLSMHSEGTYGERALRAGALGYLMKQDAMEYLSEALGCMSRGQIWVSDALARRLQLAGKA